MAVIKGKAGVSAKDLGRYADPEGRRVLPGGFAEVLQRTRRGTFWPLAESQKEAAERERAIAECEFNATVARALTFFSDAADFLSCMPTEEERDRDAFAKRFVAAVCAGFFKRDSDERRASRVHGVQTHWLHEQVPGVPRGRTSADL